MAQPLADLLRPKKLSEYVGQEHLVGENGFITKLLAPRSSQSGVGFPSLIFWGPPGSGKTTLARIIASELKREFYEFSAVNTKITDIQKIAQSQELHLHPSGASVTPIVFIDEIHRFNKAQQDKLLPFVEHGDIILIGATTENPSFEVIGPLLSRTRVLVLKNLETEELKKIIKRGEKRLEIEIEKKALDFLIEASNGDARVALNVLEIASNLIHPSGVPQAERHTSQPRLIAAQHHPRGVMSQHHPWGGRVKRSGTSDSPEVKLKDIEEALQRRQLTFDRQGEEFYNVISAFIKSMRASDVDAALYYLARMVEAGQDPLYIARRMVVFASEDIGMAQPTALVVANEVFRACETIGFPECQENLAAGVVYLATAKKDRSAYDAYMSALSDVRRLGNLSVPLKIRNPVTKLMKDLDYGKGYEKYDKESHLPDKLKGKKYYNKP